MTSQTASEGINFMAKNNDKKPSKAPESPKVIRDSGSGSLIGNVRGERSDKTTTSTGPKSPATGRKNS